MKCTLNMTDASDIRDGKLIGHQRVPSTGVQHIAMISHAATQQIATPIIIKEHGPLEAIRKFLGFNSGDEDRKWTLREMGTLIMLLVLLVVFSISMFGFFIMWFTELYDDSLLSNLLLIKNTTAVKWWISPPLDPYLKIHIFNYTNTERFLKGLDKKLTVEDMGPYVYIEKFEKVNVTFYPNHTISYKEHRSYEFQPQLSSGKQYDQLVIPNIPMLTTAMKTKYSNMIIQIAANTLLSSTHSRPFKVLPAHSFIWGYDDPLIEMSKRFLHFNEDLPFEKFGMLATRNGTSRDTLTIFSGEDDIRKLAVIDNFNGLPKLDFWSTDECNRVDGTDGSQFPPHFVNKKHSLEIFIKSFCRKLPLVYDSDVNIFDGIPAWRYKAPMNVFANPKNNSANQCYCHMESGICPPSGVFNVTKCFNAPIYASFPHFFTGDESLFKNIDGLQPNEEKHRTYADIHPRLAFPIDGASRFQINVQVQKCNMLTDLDTFEDNQILPVLWMEIGSGEITDELRAMIYHSTFSANAIQLSLRYGTLLLCVTTLAMLVAAFYYRGKTKDQQKFNESRKSTHNESIHVEQIQ